MDFARSTRIGNENPFKIDVHDDHAINSIASLLLNYFSSGTHDEIIAVCIGTDRSTGDALGPLVGSKLKKFSLPGLHVYGTLEHPVHAMNLAETIEQINTTHKNAFIIAVDACLGQLSSVGHIQLGHGPLKPGAGVNKDLPAIGDIHLTGIVNVGGFMEYFVLQNTRLNLVMELADSIASSILASITGLLKKETALTQ